MDPWYKVVTPRKEVREGRSFNPNEFAIALEQVVAGGAPEELPGSGKILWPDVLHADPARARGDAGRHGRTLHPEYPDRPLGTWLPTKRRDARRQTCRQRPPAGRQRRVDLTGC